ncbi:hypothetical protein KIN20_001647 [Parelaphostrongylus tenuis]|uniref:SCP domain-containing protein n=1 Tax=Parelaphostrongylus tenuis TaxID=148309 RepID=A0AAD5QGA7_PARTN|nr:hypothetical protein KIN20_001647 [Parelaphostrongylus tenuis]
MQSGLPVLPIYSSLLTFNGQVTGDHNESSREREEITPTKKWDCNLESFAERAVQKCPQQFSANISQENAINSKYYGPSEHILEDPIFESIEKWKKIELPLETSSNLPGDTSTFLDFFNMLNADATAVGCYSASCVDGTSTACVFSHPVPQNGARVYTPGNPCVSGGKCNSPKIGACEYGLCVITA